MAKLHGWVLALALCPTLAAQDPLAGIKGRVVDGMNLPVAGANAQLTSLGTGHALRATSSADGEFVFVAVPVGSYRLEVNAGAFAPSSSEVKVNVGDALRLEIRLDVASKQEVMDVVAEGVAVQTTSNVLGNTVSRRETADLPLNGRNFSQLGLLQPGVVPMTAGVAAHGGSRRSGHAYSTNGQRPESNNFLIDGARVVNRVDGGYALRLPVDAIEEFKILTHTAPPEYGGTSGSNTSIITRSGTNQVHGTLYEFLRNDKLDARNFFALDREPLKQNQFGGSVGGAARRDKVFLFGYYEGFRNRQGITRGATVPTEAQKSGDFSALGVPLINVETGAPYPGNRLPASEMHPISVGLLPYYPAGNISPSFASSTRVLRNNQDQAGGKADWIASEKDTLVARYAYAAGASYNPLSILGSDIPGFPVGDDLTTQLASVSLTRVETERTVISARLSFFRHAFLLEKRLSGLNPRMLGFDYDPTLAAATGAPAILVAGYSNLGDPVIGPRDTVQNDYQGGGSVAHTAGKHTMKFGAEFRRTQLNTEQGLFANGSFTFSQYPTNNPFANFLLGRPSAFTQAGGDFHRALRSWDLAWFAQDEWRVSRRITLNLGVRQEVNTPFSETRGKLNSFSPGRQSTVYPNAPAGILVPGDEGVPDTIAPIYWKGFMPRVGLAIDPGGDGKWSIRTSYAIFLDQLANGVGGPLRVASQTLPWTRTKQLSGTSINFEKPIADPAAAFTGSVWPRPASTFTIENTLRPPYAQNWNLSIQRLWGGHSIEARYVGTKGTRLPRFVDGNPAVYQAGATAANADRRRVYAGCSDAALPCSLGHIALLTGQTNSTYHAAQLNLSRRWSGGFGYSLSYTFGRTLDYVSSLHLAGPAPILISGENDVAQNPFDLRAEHGPSLFDARHRLVASFLSPLPQLHSQPKAVRAVLGGWQFNGIVTASTATPFTIYDSRNVSLQAVHPPLSGVFASRPDVITDPNAAPHTVEEWISRGAFRRLDRVLEAGEFGNAGRNIARGAPLSNVDLSLIKNFRFTESHSLQFRAECFNALNHANFGLPVNDLQSPNFGRILESGPARMIQLALKYQF